MSSSSEYPEETADALISLAMEKLTENAKSLPSALSASAELAVMASRRHQLTSKSQARQLFCNVVPFSLCGDSVNETLLDMCASYAVYRDDRGGGLTSKTPVCRKTFEYDGVVYGANVHCLLATAKSVLDAVEQHHMLCTPPRPQLAGSLMDILMRYQQARTLNNPLSLRSTAVPRMWGRRHKRMTQHRIFHSMEMVGAAVVVPLIFMLIAPHLCAEGDAFHRKGFVQNSLRLIDFCKARQASSEPGSAEWHAIDEELSAIARGLDAVANAARYHEHAHTDAADACNSLQLRVAEYMRGAWPPDNRKDRGVPFGAKRSHATLWDFREVHAERRKYSSVASSSVSGSSLSQDSTDFADGAGVSIRRLNSPTEHTPCNDQLLTAMRTRPTFE